MPHVTDQLNTALADRYRIERDVGAGGMALVYLATDLKHDRKVALKILRPELAAVIGAERFLNEIKVTANLQHPHILPLHDSGRAGGPAGGGEFLYYVMPFVEGETLRGKIEREKQLGVKEAIEITRQVASALDYAHRQGVIHRDIKPENVLLHDGQALVADFGIALAVSQAGGSRLTETGLSIGTPHYMSPEQAMGDRELDARSDVYSLGAMLYEMLTGEPPYTGPTAQAIVARVITEEPRPLTLQRRTVPAHIAAAVHQALHKLPADRFASAAEFAAALENPAFTSTATRSSSAVATALPPYRRTALPALAAVALLATALAAWGWLGRPTAPEPVTRERVTLGALGTFPFHVAISAAISPDGQTVVWWDTVGGSPQLWSKERNQRDPAPLPGTQGATGTVAFSPDGSWLAFSVANQLKKIPRRGGAPITLSDSAGNWGAAWLDDGTIAFGGPGPAVLYTVPSEGGTTERVLGLTDLNGDAFLRLAPVPGRRAVLVGGVQPNFAAGNVWVVDLDRREPHLLVAGSSWAEYLSGNRLLYATREGALLAAPVDLDDYSVGTPTSLDDGLRVTAGVAEAALGRDGTLLYARATGTTNPATLLWVDRTGVAEPVDRAFTLTGVPLNGGMRLSPDGTRLAFTAVGEAGTTALDIYVKRLPTGPAARVTFQGTSNRRPTWSADGTRLLFISNRGGTDAVWSQRADGVGAATQMILGGMANFEALWSPDGKWLIYRTDDDAGVGRGDIMAVRTDGDTTPVALVATPAEETGPAISPDSRWLAYAADETGRKEIYVRPFPNTEDGKWLVSTSGGTEPAWAHSGRELFYRDGAGNIVAVAFRTAGTTFEVLEQSVLFQAQTYWGNDDHRWYDVSPDDKRFIMIDPGFGVGTINLVKVTGLYSELRGR